MEFVRTYIVREPCPIQAPERIRGPEDVAAFAPELCRYFENHDRESFMAVFVDAQYHPVDAAVITTGILDASIIHPREVFRPALEANAAAILLVHNHPSGDPTPSHEDRAVTTAMEKAGVVMGIPVLDHVVVCHNGKWRSASRD